MAPCTMPTIGSVNTVVMDAEDDNLLQASLGLPLEVPLSSL